MSVWNEDITKMAAIIVNAKEERILEYAKAAREVVIKESCYGKEIEEMPPEVFDEIFRMTMSLAIGLFMHAADRQSKND
jgi:hypothetical protein